MNPLKEIVGAEHSLTEVSQALHRVATEMRPAATGAVHVTCSDEAEEECVTAFQQDFVRHLLPRMKSGHQAPFRIANLGGRYEWGAVPTAEVHFATRHSQVGYKLLVVKINAHVGVVSTPGGDRFGELIRYDASSPCCGALAALLAGTNMPFVDELRNLLSAQDPGRIPTLLDPHQVDPRYLPLFVALASARVQAHEAILDIQHHESASPTFYLVVPCVTLNRQERDTEIVCGFCTADHRTRGNEEQYLGLGDDPTKYSIHTKSMRLLVTDV